MYAYINCHIVRVRRFGNVTLSCLDGFLSKKWNVWMDYGEVDGWSGEGWMDGYSFNCYYYKSTGSGSAKETLLARRPFLPLTC